ncbi:hypothetical protein Taro_026023 [Colocasia esculenta]|uniref:Uncharacterized protein n=1 Tax=Colocasia esculenta TaxID=4460 RepID=A0A843VQ30_COLES|nr:hypothetical protein [Colocasia esculenta]
MLQFPAFMRQYPSPPLVPSSVLLPLRSGAENDEILLATEESEFEDKAFAYDVIVTAPAPGSPILTKDPNTGTAAHGSGDPEGLTDRDADYCGHVSSVRRGGSCCEVSPTKHGLNEIRKANSDVIVIGKATLDSKEEDDGEAEEDDADNIEESDGDEFEQETG